MSAAIAPIAIPMTFVSFSIGFSVLEGAKISGYFRLSMEKIKHGVLLFFDRNVYWSIKKKAFSGSQFRLNAL